MREAKIAAHSEYLGSFLKYGMTARYVDDICVLYYGAILNRFGEIVPFFFLHTIKSCRNIAKFSCREIAVAEYWGCLTNLHCSISFYEKI